MHAAVADDIAAGRHYRDALALAVERGMRPLEAPCLAGLRQLRNSGRAKAEPAHRRATALYAELGVRRPAGFWPSGA
jgi:hypothetical protein